MTEGGEERPPPEPRPDREDPATVLVVDDEERVVEAFELWLAEDYRVETATGGEAALAAIDESVDAVLLDRQMPGLSGDELLERFRETGYDCPVAMVTGKDPDFDIVDMPFDEYVSKPVDGDDVRAAVDRLLRIDGYDRRLNELYAVAQKRATLEAEKSGDELADSEEYARLRERQAELRMAVDERVAEMDPADVEWLFRSL
ncbi:DNA-binding protein [Halobacteriales archaeon QS_5_70_17]|nr:MAG: DNA-binding protein [Halobacteriales archaeon QS_5_70_17]